LADAEDQKYVFMRRPTAIIELDDTTMPIIMALKECTSRCSVKAGIAAKRWC
jgi:hypothetical protein